MHAFLLINGDPKEFATKQKAKQIPFILQKIEDARELKKFVKFSFFEKTAIIIEDIDKATAETQNAFLKNLEEPSNNLIYILTASNINNVLPTIASRCQIITVHRDSNASRAKYIVQSEHISYKTALNIKDRTEAIKFVENLIHIDHEKNIFKNQENYLHSLKNLKANGNVSLQLLNLVVRMESHGK
jgi:DNA polymerase-3 subunit delta'